VGVVGIDLGTTNTVVGCVRNGKVHVLADEKGSRLLPSAVSFHPNGEVLVGPAAKARRTIDPQNTVYSHKRLIGRSWGSPEIVQARTRFAFELKEGPGQGPLVHARGQDYTLPEISAFVLKRARQISETALGMPVERAVITVPANFNELQRASTKVAGRVSGLEVLRILNEPTAAALAYGLGRSGNERVAVYDFGGGTFDCTLLDLNGNVFEVLATAGDSFLGGDDIDTAIADRMAEAFLKQHRQDVRQDSKLYERLKTSAEEIKIALSTAETHGVVLKEFGNGSVNFQFTLTRRDLEAMITPLVERSFKVTQDALGLARLAASSFDKVILVGGTTRLPIVRRRVEAFFGSPPMDKLNPDEVVAIGAAIQAAALTEGIRKRSIPAPPGVPKRAAPSDETQENTEAMKPAFESGPPGFGFVSSSGPDKVAFASTLGSTPPSPAPAAAKPAFKTTSPGVGPKTKPMDLTAPAPAEWFPGSEQPPAPSERTFSRADPETLPQKPAPGFGAIDETPSIFSTPSGSLPSFPTFGADMPSPIGQEDETDEPTKVGASAKTAEKAPPEFGAVQDLSLVSNSGVSSSGVSNPSGAFGHVSDLSLISSPTAEALTDARTQALESGAFDEASEEQAGTLELEPSANPVAPTRPSSSPEALLDRSDLPAVVARAKPARKPSQLGMNASGMPPMRGKAPPVVAPQPFGPMERIDDPPSDTRTAAMPPAKPPKLPPSSAKMAAKPQVTTKPMTARAPIVQPPQQPGVMREPSAYPPPRPPSIEPPRHGQGSTSSHAPPRASAPPGSTAPLPPAARLAPPPAPTFDPRASHPPGFGSQAPQPFTFGSAPPGAFGSAPPGPPPAMHHSAPPAALPSAHPAAYHSAPPLGSQPPPYGSAFASAPPAHASHPPGYASVPPLRYQAPLLVDVTPRALVVETAGGYVDTIIPRNAKIPCERTRRFATGRDMQTSVRVRVAQGESPNFPQNTYLGEVELSGLRPAPRGEVTVAVTFEVDADGTLRVRARDVQTGHEARAVLQLIGIADESSVVLMINRFAQQPVVSGPSR
jgi:molecular chaperone DnaK